MNTISTALDDFLVACGADGLDAKTIRWYKGIISRMVGALGDVPFSNITRRDMREYVKSLREATARYIDAPQKPVQAGKFSDESIAGFVTALHRFWSWCAGEYNTPNPMEGIKRPKRQKPTPKAVEAGDFKRLFDACGYDLEGVRNRALLAVLGDTGCRLGGLLSMDMETLFLDKRRAVVVEKFSKERTIYMTKFTAALLLNWIAQAGVREGAVWRSVTTNEPLTESGVNQALKRLKKAAKIKGRCNAHAFRHRFAREYINNGGDISTLAKILGHEDIAITAKYYAVFDDDELHDFHDRFTPMGATHDRQPELPLL